MTHKTAKEILKIEKDKLMSEPESNRDWELITALDIAIEVLEERPKGEWRGNNFDKYVCNKSCPSCGNYVWGYENNKIVCAVCGYSAERSEE